MEEAIKHPWFSDESFLTQVQSTIGTHLADPTPCKVNIIQTCADRNVTSGKRAAEDDSGTEITCKKSFFLPEQPSEGDLLFHSNHSFLDV